jgi:FG-GAP-like repeat/Bacterial pre-peptidase C-terminal domain/Bacterial Ig-like domain
VGAGQPLTAATTVSASGVGEFVNNLDSLILLFDEAGNPVTPDISTKNGANAFLSYTSVAGGTFHVRVTAANNTIGEYALSLSGTTPAQPPFRVASTSPVDGTRLLGPLTDYTVDFNDLVLLTTLSADDLTFNGIAATGVTIVDGDTAIFTVPAGVDEGRVNVAIAAGAIDDIQGTPLGAFAATYYNDVTAPRVVASSIQAGETDIPAGELVYTVTFSEAMYPFIDPFYARIYGQYFGTYYSPSSIVFDGSGTTATITYAGLPEDAYTLTLTSGPFRDIVGFALDGEPVAWPIPPNESGDGFAGGDFYVSFATDAGTRALPTPLVPVNPLGSLIYQSSNEIFGVISFSGDTDDFTINVDAGQTLTILVQAGFSLQASIEVYDPSNGLVGSATGASAGSAVVLQTVPAASAGTYTITIGGGGSLGTYTPSLSLNAALEAEAHGGTSNNDRAGAQDLGSSFIGLAPGADRGAVLGESGNDDFYSFSLSVGDSVSLGLVRMGQQQPLYGNPNFVYTSAYYNTNVASGDVNGDGNADLATTSYYYSTVSVMLGNGDGTFSFPGVFYAGNYPEAVAVGDVTGDAKADLVVTHYYDGVWVFPGDGFGSFGSPYTIGGGTDIPYVTLANVNGDAALDIIAANYGSNNLSVFLNDGFGSFSRTDYFAGTGPQSVSVADVSGDTYADLVVGNEYDSTFSSGGVSVLLGDGAGGFGGPTTYSTGGPSSDAAVADFNGDGHLDVVATSYAYWNVAVLLNNGDGTFGAPTVYAVDSYPTSVAAQDVNADGNVDIVTANLYGSVSVLLNGGTGTFGSPTNFYAGNSHSGDEALVLDDFNADGLPDIATPNYYDSSVSVLLNQTSFLTMELQDDTGTVLATGTAGAENLDLNIGSYVATTDGTYYVHIGGAGQRDYSLVVTRNAAFDTEPNNSIATAQPLDLAGGTATVLGYGKGVGSAVVYATASGYYNSILELDSVTGAIVGSIPSPIPVGSGPDGLGYDGGSLFLVNPYVSDQLWELDPATGAVIDVDSLGTGSQYVDGVAVLNGLVYISNSGTDQILVFDPVADTIVNILSPAVDLGGGLSALTGPDALVASVGFYYVALIDPTTGAVTSEFPATGNVYGLATVDGQILVGGSFAAILTYRRDGSFLGYASFPNSIWSLGADNVSSAPLPDVFAVTLDSGGNLAVSTRTPGGGPGEFLNNFDPIVRVFDAEGTLLGEDDNSLDGRNALLSLFDLAAGTYYIEVASASATSGEYTLSISTDSASPALALSAVGNRAPAATSGSAASGAGIARTPAAASGGPVGQAVFTPSSIGTASDPGQSQPQPRRRIRRTRGQTWSIRRSPRSWAIERWGRAFPRSSRYRRSPHRSSDCLRAARRRLARFVPGAEVESPAR